MYKETLPLHLRGRFKEASRDLFLFLFDLLKFEVDGQENLGLMREGNPAIVVFFPHCGHPDAPAVRKAFPPDLRRRLVYSAAADYWYSSRLRSGLTTLFLKSFPMARDGSGKAITDGLDIAEGFLNSGYSIVISPEGTRSSLPLKKRIFHLGPAELVIRTNLPVIPVRLRGFEEIMPKGTALPRLLDNGRRRLVSVSIGEPMFFDLEAISGTRSQQRQEITSELRQRLLAM